MKKVFASSDVIVIDDFMADPQELRGRGLDSVFIDHYSPSEGQIYKRVCSALVPEVVENLEKIFGRDVDTLGMGFRLNYEGELPNQCVHADLGWGEFALVLYLSEPPLETESGTAFWLHQACGADRILKGQDDVLAAVSGDWDNVESWQQEDFVPSRLNRAVIYKSELFHSRWPFAAYGTTPEDGRLILVAFFNLE